MSARKLPDGWTHVKLGDVVDQIKDRVASVAIAPDVYVPGGSINRRSHEVSQWLSVDDGLMGPAFHMVAQPGDVLYKSRVPHGVAVADRAGICANTTYVLRTRDNDVLLQDFIPHVLSTSQFLEHESLNDKGSTNLYLNFSDIAKYEFALPPLDEQQRIAEVIGAVDLCIQELSRVEARTYELVDALASTLDSLAIGHASLGELADVTVGIVVKPADLYVSSGGVPALRSLNVAPGRLVWDDIVSISNDGHLSHAKSKLASGDVVIVRSGRPGDAAVIPDGLGPLNAIDLLIARCRSDAGITPDLLVTYLNSSSGRQQMLGRSAGTAQQHLNAGQLKQVRVPLVAMADQHRVRDRVDSVGRVRQAALDELAEARQLRSALLAECLEGSADVQ